MNSKTSKLIDGYWMIKSIAEIVTDGNMISDYIEVLQKINRLRLQHQRPCENACNGVGFIGSKKYYNGRIDDYARREHGQDIQSAYISNPSEDSDGETVFDQEIERIQSKIDLLCLNFGVKPEYQHDPRGWTVKLTIGGRMVDWGLL